MSQTGYSLEVPRDRITKPERRGCSQTPSPIEEHTRGVEGDPGPSRSLQAIGGSEGDVPLVYGITNGSRRDFLRL